MENMVNNTTSTYEVNTSPAAQAQVATPVAPVQQPDMSMYMLKSDAQKRTKRGAIVGGIAGAAGGLGLGILGTVIGKKIGEHKTKKNVPAAQDTPPAPAASAQPQLMQITPEQLAQLNAMAAAQATPEPAPAAQQAAEVKKK